MTSFLSWRIPFLRISSLPWLFCGEPSPAQLSKEHDKPRIVSRLCVCTREHGTGSLWRHPTSLSPKHPSSLCILTAPVLSLVSNNLMNRIEMSLLYCHLFFTCRNATSFLWDYSFVCFILLVLLWNCKAEKAKAILDSELQKRQHSKGCKV